MTEVVIHEKVPGFVGTSLEGGSLKKNDVVVRMVAHIRHSVDGADIETNRQYCRLRRTEHDLNMVVPNCIGSNAYSFKNDSPLKLRVDLNARTVRLELFISGSNSKQVHKAWSEFCALASKCAKITDLSDFVSQGLDAVLQSKARSEGCLEDLFPEIRGISPATNVRVDASEIVALSTDMKSESATFPLLVDFLKKRVGQALREEGYEAVAEQYSELTESVVNFRPLLIVSASFVEFILGKEIETSRVETSSSDFFG